MDFSEHRHEPTKKLIGITAVIFVHALLFYALLNGLGKQIISLVQETTIEVRLIAEEKPSAPQDLPPPTPLKEIVSAKPTVPRTMTQAQVTPIASEASTELASQSEAPPQESIAPPSTSKGPSIVHAVVDFTTCKKPDYPRNSLRNEEHGTVRLQFLIGTDGQVADSKIETSSGFRSLDTAAKKALSLCKFKPGTVDGKPQQSWTTVSYIWKLPD